jgi:hypothetical protein
MGVPAVVFVTANSNDSNTANSYGKDHYGEVFNDKVPQSERYGTDSTIPEDFRGEFQVDVYDLERAITGVQHLYANGDPIVGSTVYSTAYSTRSTLGTFPIGGGGFEQMEFSTGDNTSSISGQTSGAGTYHNYVAFANTGNGNNISYSATGGINPTGSAGTSHGPTTAYNSSTPFANIEFDCSHTSCSLKASSGIIVWTATAGGGHGGSAGTALANNVTKGIFAPAYVDTYNQEGENWTHTFSPINSESRGGGYSRAGTLERQWGANGAGELTTYTGWYGGRAEMWYPGLSYSNETPSGSLVESHRGSIIFKLMPDTEHTMTANMVTTTVGVSSISVSAHGSSIGSSGPQSGSPTSSGAPIATHSRVTVTTSAAHKMTDTQNQVVIAGGTNITHVNGLWNVATVPSTTSFTYDVPYSSASTTSVTGTLTCVTFDGIDKTGAIVKSGSSVVGEIVHGGNAGNNKVILRGDVSLSGSHTIHSNSTSTSIATVNFTGSRTYKSMFHDAGLELNETTGAITSNGTFDGINDKGLKQLDGYFPKYKNGRDYAVNQAKTDGTISQAPIAVGADSDIVTIHGGDGELPSSVFFKSVIYANGHTANVKYATALGNSSVKPSVSVENIATISGPDEGAAGETYSLTYNDIQFPTPNTSSYWAMKRADSLRIIDPDDTSSSPDILTYVSTAQMFYTPVHFTIRAMKNSSHSPTGSSTKTISGWGTYENGEHNYVDGRLYLKVYNNTDADRDGIITVYGDANNADSATSDNFNRNETAKKIDNVAVTNEEFLQNNYSNGNFTVISSV